MTKLISAFVAMASFYGVTGCESVPPAGTNSTIVDWEWRRDIDLDLDGIVDVGVPGGDISVVIQQSCSSAPNDNFEETCISTLSSALRGTGDCDGYPANDPAVCFDGGLNCSLVKYSVCASCIHPAGNGVAAATEVCDGVDNDCDAQVDEGLANCECQVTSDCDSGETCTNNVCVTTGCVDNNGCLDNQACNVNTHVCVNLQCNDNNACTTDGTALHLCTNIVVAINDLNACTTDACNITTGAVTHTAVAIDDANACTTDACNATTGAITHTAVAIDDANSCTTDACNTTSGAITHVKILGCAAVCNVEHDNDGEATSDCAPYRDPQLSTTLYGWGCNPTSITTDPANMGSCVAYEDQDNDEFADKPERFCADGIDGDLDGQVDGADSDCANCANAGNCDDGNSCTVDTCTAGSNTCSWSSIANCVSCETNAQCSLGQTCGTDHTCHTTTPTTCSAENPCPSGYYCADGVAQCFVFSDLRGDTSPGQSGLASNPDGTADNYDNDGDGYCETAPCVGSRNPNLAVGSLQGGDCDDYPSPSGTVGNFTVGTGTGAFETDGSFNNHPGATDWPNSPVPFDNACKGPPFI